MKSDSGILVFVIDKLDPIEFTPWIKNITNKSGQELYCVYEKSCTLIYTKNAPDVVRKVIKEMLPELNKIYCNNNSRYSFFANSMQPYEEADVDYWQSAECYSMKLPLQ